ncbi:pumilio homology domain family member [Anaeramoeba flamelloides]|uniref:Pumilio homology domain family member n=1 Tax=Anaeramoeba flamelloides TaxID=1746091 RepID=A0AAV8A6Y6_9EUKA|nr:pumilio homology domain family member [Anaeramoeba flamelloides]
MTNRSPNNEKIEVVSSETFSNQQEQEQQQMNKFTDYQKKQPNKLSQETNQNQNRNNIFGKQQGIFSLDSQERNSGLKTNFFDKPQQRISTNKHLNQKEWFPQFPNNQREQRIGHNKRRVMRTSPSSESLTRGTSFDLYRKTSSIFSTPLNPQNLFTFDLTHSRPFSQNTQKPQNLKKSQSFFSTKKIGLTTTTTQKQNENENQKQANNQLLTRSSSMFLVMSKEMENLENVFQKITFGEENNNNKPKPKPKQLNNIKKKSMTRVRSFDQLPNNKQNSMVKSQTTNNLRTFTNKYEQLLPQNNGFSQLRTNYNQNFSNNRNFLGYLNNQQSRLKNYDFETRTLNENNQPKNEYKLNNKTILNTQIKQQEYSPINEYIGNIYKTSQNQYGCRSLQNIIETNDASTVQIIFSELKGHFEELMKDQFGNYLCQQLFQFSSHVSIYDVLIEIQQVVIPISTNLYGTRAIQKLIDCITTEEQEQILFKGFSKNLIALINNSNGNHVVQKCFIKFSQKKNEYIFQSIVENCLIITCHKHGCCVMQRCIDFAPIKYRDALTDSIINNAVDLIQNPFANYVIQYMLNNDIRADEIIEAVKGHMIKLATQKFSSNVVEKCLRVANDKTRKLLIDEFIENEDSMKTLLMDNYANYVVQTSIKLATPNQYTVLYKLVKPLVPYIRNKSCLKKIQSLLNRDQNNLEYYHNNQNTNVNSSRNVNQNRYNNSNNHNNNHQQKMRYQKQNNYRNNLPENNQFNFQKNINYNHQDQIYNNSQQYNQEYYAKNGNNYKMYKN